MKDKDFGKAMTALSDSRNCDRCPLEPLACRRVSRAFFDEERCLLLVALSEILAFHTEDYKKKAKEFRESVPKKKESASEKTE